MTAISQRKDRGTFSALRLKTLIAATAVLAASASAQVGSVGPNGLVFFGDRVVKESIASTAPVVQISSGRNFAVALRADGTVAAWGADQLSQCEVPPGLLGVTQVAAGDFHSLLLLSNGTVRSFGFNNYGQTTVPAGLTGVVQIAAGSSFSVAVKSDGTVVEWGQGQGSYLAPPAGLTHVVQVAAGYGHIIARKSDGSVVAWGAGSYGETVVPPSVSNAVQVAAAYQHSAALLANGTVVCWGDNTHSESTPPSALSGVKEIALGATHSLALQSTGAVVAWGSNSSGERNPPSTLSNVQHISAAYATSYALDNTGTVTGWGTNTFGETLTPTNFSNVAKVAAGLYHLLLLKNDGTVVAWGDNTYNQSNVPSTPGIQFTDVSAGSAHSLLTADPLKAPYLFGSNSDGQISPPGLTQFDHLWALGRTSYGHLKSGGVLSWGDNYYGQRNLPNTIDYLQITGGPCGALGLKPDGTLAAVGLASYGLNTVPSNATNIIQIASGTNHNLALKNDGTVIAWGVANNPENTVPSGLSSVIGVAAGDAHSIALRSDGSVVGWGDNTYGQSAPPYGLIGMAQVAAGQDYTVCVPRMSLTVAPYSVTGGHTSLGTVYLPSPAPGSGLTITLATDNSIASVPGFVTVPAGSTSANFTITTTNPAETTQTLVTATFGSLSQSSLLTVVPASFTMGTSVPAVVGGSPQVVNLWVTLTNPAPAGGATVTLTCSDNVSLTVPMQIVVPAGKLTKQIVITDARVHVPTPVTITGSYTNTVQTSNFTVNPYQVTAFTLSPATGIAGMPMLATVTLNAKAGAPVDVTLTSSDNSAITGPVTLTVPANSKTGTATLTPNSVSASTPLTLTASLDGSSLSKNLTVVPALTISTSAASVVGGSTTVTNLTIKLATAAPSGGASVSLTSSDPAVSFANSPVLVPAGQQTLVVPISTSRVTASTAVTIGASYGVTTAEKTFTVLPFKLTSFALSPATVMGGFSVVGTATLNATPAAPVLVAVASSNPATVPGPLTLTCPAGSTTGTLTIPTKQVAGSTTVLMTASLNGAAKSVKLVVNPVLASVSFSAASVYGAGQFNCTIKLTSPAPANLTLTLGGTNCQIQTTTWVIAAGQTTTSFPAVANDMSTASTLNVSVTYGLQSVSGSVAIKPNTLTSLVVTPTTFVGSSSTVVTAVATLVAPVSYDVFVNTSSSNQTLVSIPSTIKIPAGSSTGSVTLTHSAAPRATTVTLTGSHAGATRTAKVTVN